MSQVFKFILQLLVAIFTGKAKTAKQKLMIELLGDAFELAVPKTTKIKSLPLPDFAQQIFAENKLVTVGDAIEAYSLGKDTPGIGNKTWQYFFDAARGIIDSATQNDTQASTTAKTTTKPASA